MAFHRQTECKNNKTLIFFVKKYTPYVPIIMLTATQSLYVDISGY